MAWASFDGYRDGSRAGLAEPLGQPAGQRPAVGSELDLDLSPRQQLVVHRCVDLVVGDLCADALAVGFADAIPRALGADRRHVDQLLAQAQSGQQLLEIGGRRVGQRGANFDAALGVRNLELPAGVVVAVPSPQHDPVRLQVVVGGVVVGALQVDGGPVDLAVIDQVVEARQHKIVVDVPFVFAFEQLMHDFRLSA